jgi:hypothetical protein
MKAGSSRSPEARTADGKAAEMHLIKKLLRLHDKKGAAFGPDLYREAREELSSRDGGLTAFARAPVEGHREVDGKTTRDDLVVFEVMAEELTYPCWRGRGWSVCSGRM